MERLAVRRISGDGIRIVWFRWRGWDYTLKRASMMIKPKGLQPNT
ncbi:hypothetical protein RR46_08283 [Papilio xuthus]|uniref:Uncharacterized protein n=1 Tax=Papilio xuthus TaxID=66420 RepID=A0A194PF02_PAPXU|nr:hypothetical protein RR46_08283 [Papilio xuthus]